MNTEQINIEPVEIDFQLSTCSIYGKFFTPPKDNQKYGKLEYQEKDDVVWISSEFLFNPEDISFINKALQSFWNQGGYSRKEVNNPIYEENDKSLNFINVGGESVAFIFQGSNGKQIIKVCAQRFNYPRGFYTYPNFQPYPLRMVQVESIRFELGKMLKETFNINFPSFYWLTSQVAGIEYIEGDTPSQLDFTKDLEQLMDIYLANKFKYNPSLWEGVRADLKLDNFIVTPQNKVYWIDVISRFKV